MSESKLKQEAQKIKQHSVLDRMPEGTQALSPEYFNEAIIGFSYQAIGGVSLCYSAELCIDLIKRNEGLDTEQASEHLAAVCGSFVDANPPVFVWGLD
jgi:hypothetical protein